MKTVEYDAKVDAKKRITIRNANYNYYHVREMESGVILLEPRELRAPFQISANTLAMMDENFKAGKVSNPVDFSDFLEVNRSISNSFPEQPFQPSSSQARSGFSDFDCRESSDRETFLPKRMARQ